MKVENSASARVGQNEPRSFFARLAALAGLGLFALYVVTLSRGLYPGVSAAWMSAAIGLEPWPNAAYPLWRFWLAGWRHLPIGGNVWRLNLSSAVAAAAAGGLLCRYVASWVYRKIEAADALPAERRIVAAASISALVAAAIFGTSLAGWGIATRLHPFAFDVLLVMIAFILHQGYLVRHGVWRLYLLALLCGAGAAETTMFLVLAPFFIIATLLALDRRRLTRGLGFRLACIGVSGLLLYVVAACCLAPVDAGMSWHGALRQLLRLQIHDLRAYLPGMGWLTLLLMLVLPWVTLQAGAWPTLSDHRTLATIVLHLLLTAAVLILLVNVPIPPWRFWAAIGRPPVLEMLLVAMLGGWACAYWLRGCLVPWQPPAVKRQVLKRNALERDQEIGRHRQKQMMLIEVVCSAMMCALLAGTLLVACVRNGRVADGRRGAFADQCAREILDQMGARTWLVTDGVLDRHLARLAAARGQTLHLVNVSQDRQPSQAQKLRALVDADPRLLPYQARLRNAAMISASAFVREWLAADPAATGQLALYSAPDLSRTAGRRALPDRFLFLAAQGTNGVDRLPPMTEAIAFWKRMDQIVPLTVQDRDLTDGLQRALRWHLALVANDRGVLLEDLQRPLEAQEAYRQALRLNPDNLSALLNRMQMAREGMLPPEERKPAEQAAAAALAKLKRRPSFLNLARFDGQVRAPEAYAGLGSGWMSAGQMDLARIALTRAAELGFGDENREAFLGALASFSLTTGDFAHSEDLFRRILGRQPGDQHALIGLLRLALLQRDTAEARTCLARARAAGLPASACNVEESTIELAENKTDAACARLRGLLDLEPNNLYARALLVTAMVKQGQAEAAASEILPRLIQSAGRAPNALVFQLQGLIAASRQPPAYPAAREAYRHAAQLQPGRQDLLVRILRLDLDLADQKAAEQDARDVLQANPDNGLAHFVLGSQAAARGELDTAERHLRCSIAAGATGSSWNNLADVLRQRGALDEAETAARQAIAMTTNSAAALDTLACVLLERHQTAEAQTTIARARALAPQDWQVAFTMARAQWQAGRHAESRQLLREVRTHQQALPPNTQAQIARLTAEWSAQP